MKAKSKDAFIAKFGQTCYESVMLHVGRHSESTIPEDEEQRLYFGLLEILDFECFNYDHCHKKLTKKSITSFLKPYSNKIKCDPPSYMGFIAGAFNEVFSN